MKMIFCSNGEMAGTYKAYLQTEHWKLLRDEMLMRAKHCCRHCGVSIDIKPLAIHHKTYDHLGYERMDELVVLCWHCHCIEHHENPYLNASKHIAKHDEIPSEEYAISFARISQGAGLSTRKMVNRMKDTGIKKNDLIGMCRLIVEMIDEREAR